MDKLKALNEMTAAPGVTGNERAGVADVVEKYFRTYTSDVWRSAAGNVYARMGAGKPVILMMAHMDEVGMIVNKIEDNGMLRIGSVAGVDPRVLPGSQVTVYGREALPGVVGAIPPHLLGSDTDKSYKIADLCCDVGLSRERVEQLVSVGDNVTFAPLPILELKNGRIAGKTFDDRSLILCMLQTMEYLTRRSFDCTVVFCASVQEEKGSLGALTGTHHIDPDMAIATDVCHAPGLGADPMDTVEIDRLSIACGSNIHPKLLEMIRAAAKEAGVSYEMEAMMGATGTDGWEMQISNKGVPTAIVSLPLRYMHTNVELIEMNTLVQGAKLLTEFICSVGADWEAKLCLDD